MSFPHKDTEFGDLLRIVALAIRRKSTPQSALVESHVLSPVLSSPLRLASSPWPMTGHDPQRSGRSPLPGPRQGRILRHHPLPHAERTIAGLTVHEDGTLCLVTSCEILFFRTDGRVASGRLPRMRRRTAPSPATALAGGTWASTHGRHLLRWSSSDESPRLRRVDVGDVQLDDSLVSPGFSAGHLLLGAITGEVLTFDGETVKQVGARGFGYDVLPPTTLPDGSLIVVGYAGKGLCCVNLEGSLRWRLPEDDVDLMATVHSQGMVAVGALNKNRSLLVSDEGTLLHIHPEAALWAEQGPEGWVCWSRQALSELDLSGVVRWRLPWPEEDPGSLWAQRQPVVDGQGWSYALHRGGLLAVTPEGQVGFSLAMAGAGAMALVSEGLLVVATEEAVLWVS